VRDITAYQVEQTRPGPASTTFDVAVGGEGGGQREYLALGPGIDRSGVKRSVLVLRMELIQKAGTS
jgi:hypothetical protein